VNDWMQHEVLRQASEAGDPAAQTGSWVLPSRRRFDLPVLLGVGAMILMAVLAVLLSGAMR
jgi:hypothetical protein